MKKCTYCGKEYPDDATVCVLDEQPLKRVGPPPIGSQTDPVGQPAVPPQVVAAVHAAANRNMLVGGLVCIGGILVTVLTYSIASSAGGSYFVAWGAIVFGAIQFFRGLAAKSRI
jgi:hypothetical protein